MSKLEKCFNWTPKNYTSKTQNYSPDFRFKHLQFSCIYILIEPINKILCEEMIEIKKALRHLF